MRSNSDMSAWKEFLYLGAGPIQNRVGRAPVADIVYVAPVRKQCLGMRNILPQSLHFTLKDIALGLLRWRSTNRMALPVVVANGMTMSNTDDFSRPSKYGASGSI
ncbi:hypothetical protein EVAR_7229_1 [Eumeta japonica]|uniref:Uncharacterized protein n=1 Tax=Eumeta variegata TaxID=151549 RepID=A0A4C1T5S4_EUMVA|nr:hypothetical protein EVAR_7229_1 [Eumeta japonica]